LSSQDAEIQKKLKKVKIKNYGFLVKGDEFKFFDTYATSPYMFALAYALSVANSGQAKNITLAGMDGYNNNDALNLEMNELIKSYYRNKKSIKAISITPTKYKIDTKSVFSI
jgi:4-hydroxy 2-oxovalerate aldolase